MAAVVRAALKKELPGASVSFPKIMSLPHDATTTELKNAFRHRAAALHPDSPTGDAKSFANLLKAFKTLVNSRQPEEYCEGPGGQWISTTRLLLLLLRGVGPDEWERVLACVSDECLKEVCDMASGDGTQIQNFLSRPHGFWLAIL